MTKTIPTPAESIVLQLLWERQKASVPELHADICRSGKVAYTTVLKRIQRMEEKGLVKRLPGPGRAITYAAAIQPKNTRKTLLSRLIATAFDNSPNSLIQHAIDHHKLTSDDIADIRALLDELEEKDARK